MDFFSGNPKLNSPVDKNGITRAEAELKVVIPECIVDFWNKSNGLSFPINGVTLYGTDDISERNNTYEVVEYIPDMILIGDDSGGNGFFVHKYDTNCSVSKIDLGALGSIDGVVVADNLSLWLSQGCPLDNFRSDSKKDLQTPKIDILLKNFPKDGIKGLIMIKQKLCLQHSIVILKTGLDNLPLTLLSDVFLSKYSEACEEINNYQDCLEIIYINK